ncbi:MAG: TVP38/TMEM64 family protein [Promethearchaeota archaeon]
MAELNEKIRKRGILIEIIDWIKGMIDPRGYDTFLEYIFVLIFIGLVVLMGGMYLYTFLGYVDFIPVGDEEFLTTMIVTWFLIPMTLVGIFAIPLFFSFMVLQAVVLAIPSELVMLTAGMLWGGWFGGIINILGAQCAAIILFYFSRRGGRPFAIKSVGEKNFVVVDDLLNRYGIWAIVIGRMIPFIPFDLISVVSGVVDIKWRDYLIGTLIGVIPRAFFYSFIGWFILDASGVDSNTLLLMLINDPTMFESQISAMSLPFNVLLTVVILGVGLAFIPYYLWMRKQQKKLNRSSL